MTAITRRLLHLRRQSISLPHFFSTSSPSNIPPPQSESVSESESKPNSKPSFSSYFNDVRASLKREPPSHNRPHTPPPPPKSAFFEEIRRNLAEFRSRSAPPPPSRHNGDVINDSNGSSVRPPAGRSFDAIKQSIVHLRGNSNAEKNNQSDQMSLSRIRESLNLKPAQSVGGSDGLPSFFEKERNAGEDGSAGNKSARLMRMYNYSELGTKLKTLRPEKKKGKWFSLNELNDRLAKLREVEEKESQGSIGGVSWRDLRETVVKLALSDEEKTKKKTMQRLDILGQLGGTPNYMLSDPKDNLVEKYFHPDNMSSAEKLKLELKKIRDEFKMSESDCGSSRVQVAQLTVKIKHLSSVLHKKDKHSLRGLRAMAERRKKLMKYLRRTDWDSYCLLLSKLGHLGLREIPDTKLRKLLHRDRKK